MATDTYLVVGRASIVDFAWLILDFFSLPPPPPPPPSELRLFFAGGSKREVARRMACIADRVAKRFFLYKRFLALPSNLLILSPAYRVP
jgi:hypothetical protein